MSNNEETGRHRSGKRHRHKKDEERDGDLFDMTAPGSIENAHASSSPHHHKHHREKTSRRKKHTSHDEDGDLDIKNNDGESPKKWGDRDESPKHKHKKRHDSGASPKGEHGDDEPRKSPEKKHKKKEHDNNSPLKDQISDPAETDHSKKKHKKEEVETESSKKKHEDKNDSPKKHHKTEEITTESPKKEDKSDSPKKKRRKTAEVDDEAPKKEEKNDSSKKKEKDALEPESKKEDKSDSPKKKRRKTEETIAESPKKEEKNDPQNKKEKDGVEPESKKEDKSDSPKKKRRKTAEVEETQKKPQKPEEKKKTSKSYSQEITKNEVPERNNNEQQKYDDDDFDFEIRTHNSYIRRRTQEEDEELRRSQGASRTEGKSGPKSTHLRPPTKIHVLPVKEEPPREEHHEEEEPEHNESPDGIAQWLMDGGSVSSVSPDKMPDVISSLQTMRDNYLIEHEVDLCEKADELIVAVRDRLQLEMKLQAQRDQADNFVGRLQNAQDNCSRLEVTTKRTLAKIREKHAKETEELKQRQMEEENELIERWQRPQILRRFNRASTLLQAMRKQSTILLAQRNYKDLRENEKRVAALEARERNEQYRFMRMEYDEQVRLLREKHRAETEVLRVAQEGREQTFLAAAAVDLDRAKKRVQAAEVNLDNTADADKLWNLRYRYERPPTSRSLTAMQARKIIVQPHAITDLRLPPLVDPRKTTRPRGTIMRPQTTLRMAP